jgi:hypothetical protein
MWWESLSLVCVPPICVTVNAVLTDLAIWVEWWTASNLKNPNSMLGYWLGIYGWIAVMAVSTLVLACWYVWALS